MNTPLHSFSLSPQDKQKYAILQSVFAAITADQQAVISGRALRLEDGSWSVINERISNEVKWTLHMVMQAPTFELLESLASQLAHYVEDFTVYVHRCSNWQEGRVGFVIAIDDDAAKAIKASDVLNLLANDFHLEIALLADAPKLAVAGLLVMDMDSTVIAVECIDEIATLAGVGEKVAEVTERAMQGELDFAQSLVSRVACLQGLSVSALAKVRDQLPLMPGLMRLINELQSNRWHVAIASGGFTYFADHLKQRLGFDEAVANVLTIDSDKLTGEVDGRIVDANVKAETVDDLAERWQISTSQTIAMGDGANDLVMMKRAQLGIAYKAKPIVQAKADSSVRFSGLDTALFYLR